MAIIKQLELEHMTLIEEYKTLREEIVCNLNASRRILNLSFTAIGAFLIAAPFIVQLQAPTIFIIIPLLFYGIAWTQLKYTFNTIIVGNYINSNIIPRVREILSDFDSESTHGFDSILTWETKAANLMPHYGFSVLLINAADFGVPITVAIISFVTYFTFLISESRSPSTIEIVLITLNLFALIYSIYWGFKAALRHR